VPSKFSMKNAPATTSATTADCLADDDCCSESVAFVADGATPFPAC
jgi:hypothetical protein